MPISGGQAGISGYDYQLWFTAYQFCKTLSNEKLVINPEAVTINEPIFNSEGSFVKTITKTNYINDVVVYENKIPTVYNIKYMAPEDTTWTVNKLVGNGVINDILRQLKKYPQGKIIFVSQSPCNLLSEIFKRARNVKTTGELFLRLNNKQQKEWKTLKTKTHLSDSKLIAISKSVEYKRGYEEADYIDIIKTKVINRFNNAEFIPNVLHILATESAKEGKYIDRDQVIKWFEINNIREMSLLKTENLIEDSKKISASLKNWVNIFGNLKSSHLKRKEVDKIFNWIISPILIEKRPVIIITGKAGCGKSVIMRDLIEELDKVNIINIALKLDLYDVSSYSELLQKLNVKEDFEKQINSLANNGKLVLIFDQLDSLSLTLSKNRKSILFYTDLINRLSFIPNIRVILTCRIYDLHYDSSLKAFEKETIIEVGELNTNEVNDVIKYFDLTLDKLPLKVGKLLLNPQHLNIFCDIYDEHLKLEEIKTIQDLYNELWQKKILDAPIDISNLKIMLAEIVQEMASEQKLNINKLNYIDRYSKEMKYLLSENIFFENKNIIQFFHQSFFEYCFARNFVTDKKNLFEFIESNHQGLFIRSTTKHVINYLKSVNTKEYLITLMQLLQSNSVRFHIKHLLFNILGSEDNPIEEEWVIVKKTILLNPKIRHYFIESMSNLFWFDKLKEGNRLLKYLNSNDDKLRRSCEVLFYNLIDIDPKPILKYLLESQEFKGKISLIERILVWLKDWDNEESLELFYTIKDKFNDWNSNTELGRILGNAIDSHKETIAKYLGEYLNRRFQSINAPNFSSKGNFYNYDIEIVFEKLYSLDSALFYQTVLPLVKDLVYRTDFGYKTVYLVDGAFFQYEQYESIYAYYKLLIHLNEYAIKLAINNPAEFGKLMIPLEKEKSLTLVSILVSGLLENITNYLETAFKLLSDKDFLVDSQYDLGVEYKVLKLLSVAYSHFSDEQKNIINKIIVEITNEKLKKNENREWYGTSGYRLLNAIPEIERKKIMNIQKRFLELQRKFGKTFEVKPFENKFSAVGTPLPENAYNKMSLKDWMNSFKEYNESTGWGNYHSNKRGTNFGGLVEHSRMFNESVKNNPNKYFLFIEKIVNENIAPDYISEGLQGLVEANYDYAQLTSLILKINHSDKIEKIKRSIIRAVEYVDRVSVLEEELIDILIDYTINDSDPAEEVWKVNSSNKTIYYGGDPLTAGINSVRGSAVFALVKLENALKFKDEIFNTLEKVSVDKSIAVRCAAIANINKLIKYDEERVFKIYKLFNKEKDPHILRNSLNCLSYYSKKKFPLLKEELTTCSQIEGNYGHSKVKNYLGQILMYVFTEGLIGSKKLFDELYFNSDEIKAGCIHYSAYLLHSKNRTKRKKAIKVFEESISSINESINNEYSNAFREFKADDFNYYYKFLLEYTKIRKLKRRELDHIIKYLLRCMELYPKECIILLKNVVQNIEIDNREFIITKEPINLLLGSYNRLKDYRLKNKDIELAMDIFDNLMQLPRFSFEASRVLQEADYS